MSEPAPVVPEPDVRDEPYGPHEANRLDLWLAPADAPTPLVVFIHGGGFWGGDKAGYRPYLLTGCLNAGLSFAAVNYRLSDEAPYPAQMLDSARAVQFLRHHADRWNLNPQRLAATGGSAGAGISMWLGFRDDLAEAASEDPVAVQSTRLRCMVVYAAQCTYDPRDVAEIAGFAPDTTEAALVQLFRLPEGWTFESISADPELDGRIREASAINHVTRGDPPVFAIYTRDAEKPGDIHHPNFGRVLQRRLSELGIECVMRFWEEYPTQADADADMVKFLLKHI